MPFRSPLRLIMSAAFWATPVAIAACGGRGPLDTDIASYDSPDASSAMPGAGDDQSEPPTDGGKLADSGGSAAKDGSTGLPGLPNFPGLPGLLGLGDGGFPDITGLLGLGADSGPIGACFACAQQDCNAQGSACLSSAACVQEGFCDLTQCIAGGATTGTGSSGGLGGLDLSCFQTCGSNAQASEELLAAVTCVFTSCGSSCLSAATSLGGTGGTGASGLGALEGLGGSATTR